MKRFFLKLAALYFFIGATAATLALIDAHFERPAHAQGYLQNSPTDPIISLTPDALAKFWSAQAGLRGVANDAQWNTAMGTLFSTSTSTGVDPTALAFLRSFFIQLVHVGLP